MFISYKREEADIAEKIKNLLQSEPYNFNVWWDRNGQVWNEMLDEAVNSAGCVITLWSKKSMASKWVNHEASRAMEKGIYTPVRIELCEIEPPYDRIQATDLMRWDGKNKDHPGVKRLISRIDELLPLPKSNITRVLDWLQKKSATIFSALFALSTVLILVLQVSKLQDVTSGLSDLKSEQSVSQERQLHQLNKFTRNQQITLRELDSFQLTYEVSAKELTGDLMYIQKLQNTSNRQLKTTKDNIVDIIGSLESVSDTQVSIKKTSDRAAQISKLSTLAGMHPEHIRLELLLDSFPIWGSEYEAIQAPNYDLAMASLIGIARGETTVSNYFETIPYSKTNIENNNIINIPYNHRYIGPMFDIIQPFSPRTFGLLKLKDVSQANIQANTKGFTIFWEYEVSDIILSQPSKENLVALLPANFFLMVCNSTIDEYKEFNQVCRGLTRGNSFHNYNICKENLKEGINENGWNYSFLMKIVTNDELEFKQYWSVHESIRFYNIQSSHPIINIMLNRYFQIKGEFNK